MGLEVVATEVIEFLPNQFNLNYLDSKSKSGHNLSLTKISVKNFNFPFDPIEPFEPY